jgi:UDP-N-acetyl-2-amino-2-deoxyglucuronate dehydrogenase
MSKNFAIIGCAGYVAPRHLKAIRDTGNRLVAAVDPHDSVGVLDQYFDNVSFFTEFERFDRHIEKLRRKGDENRIHYVSICSPNYLHDAHVRFALRIGADAICEKPVVIKPWNIDALTEIEKETGHKAYTVLQLRHHKSIIELREKLKANKSDKKHDIMLTYITPRGPWYHRIGGYVELEKARVRWLLSIDKNDLPEQAKAEGKTTYRSLTMDGDEIEFSGGFTDLHTVVYQEILNGGGFGLADARPSVELVHTVRESKPTGINSNSHPFLK